MKGRKESADTVPELCLLGQVEHDQVTAAAQLDDRVAPDGRGIGFLDQAEEFRYGQAASSP